MGQDLRQQIARYARHHIKKQDRKNDQGIRKLFPADNYRDQVTLQDAVDFLNGWLESNHYANIVPVPSPPSHGRVPRKQWTDAWAAFYDGHLVPLRINLTELISDTDEKLYALEAAQEALRADTADPFPATQMDELSDVQDSLGELLEVLWDEREHRAQPEPQGQGHPDLMDLQDEDLQLVYDCLGKLLSGQAPEDLELPSAGERGGEGNMLLTSIVEVIHRYARITGATA